MFGTNDAALESQRNGLMMHSAIKEAFDDSYIAIVPDGSVPAIPTEWKVFVLDESKFKNQVHSNPWTMLKDVDGRRLSFRNDNRPARHFRYMMAWIHADTRQFPGFKSKVPSGRICASPYKADGYLRGSVLRSLARESETQTCLKNSSRSDHDYHTRGLIGILNCGAPEVRSYSIQFRRYKSTNSVHVKKKISRSLKDDEGNNDDDDEE